MPDQPIRAVILCLAGFALYSCYDVLGKMLTAGMSPYEISFWTSLMGVACLIALSPLLGGISRTLKTRHPVLHAIRAALTAFIPALNFFALSGMKLVNFYTIVFTAPFFTVLLARIFFREKIPPRTWLLILAGFVGVVVAMRPQLDGIGWREIAVLTTSLSFSIRNLLMPRMGKDETLLSYSLYSYLAVTLFSFMPLAGNMHLPPSATWLPIILGGAAGAIGLVCTSLAFRIGPVKLVAPMHYSQIIWGILFGVLVFGNFPDILDLAGAAIVCASGIIIIESDRRAARKIRGRAGNV